MRPCSGRRVSIGHWYSCLVLKFTLVLLAMNLVDAVGELLRCGPAGLHKSLEDLTKRALALFILLEQCALVRKVPAHDTENYGLRQLLILVIPELSSPHRGRDTKEDGARISVNVHLERLDKTMGQ